MSGDLMDALWALTVALILWDLSRRISRLEADQNDRQDDDAEDL